MTTGAAVTSRFVNVSTAAATQSNITRIKNTKRPSRIRAANNYALSLIDLKHPEEVKPLLRQTIPIARRLLEENDNTTLRMRWYYAAALYLDAGATLDELREAVTTLEDVERTAQRVFGGAHPIVMGVEDDLQDARAALRASETPPSASVGA
jgi:hypothetical protein